MTFGDYCFVVFLISAPLSICIKNITLFFITVLVAFLLSTNWEMLFLSQELPLQNMPCREGITLLKDSFSKTRANAKWQFYVHIFTF